MLVMPTRSILPGTPCFLGSCAIYIHFNARVWHSLSLPVRFRLSSFGLCLPFLGLYTVLLLRSWLPRAKKHSFSAKSDRCTGTARRSDGPRRYKLASMKFNTFARCVFLRLPRSCRVEEKSEPIGSREPNYAIFQQNPIVAQADLDAPMDSDAINSQA